MISKEAYEILHELDGSTNSLARHLNWQKIKFEDPRLIKLRKLVATETRPSKKEKVITHRREAVKFDDTKILTFINQGYTLNQTAKALSVNHNTLYAHIQRTEHLNARYRKIRSKFSTIIASKNGKICAKGTVSEVAKQLNIKRNSVSAALLRHQKAYGYTLVRLKDWEEAK